MMLRRLSKTRTPAAIGIVMVGMIAASVIEAGQAFAQSMPEIRMHGRNRVPSCVTPARLMHFMADRNPNLLPKFRNIASYYRDHGERLRVRWDYAFFQMIVETNYLLFRTATRKGDVSPSQNNFAGIGTTGGGVPGDRFPDVSTGVLGQMQHLIAYSGEWVERPVAQRTRDKQDVIISASRRLRRPVTFRDLAGRWAVDRRYGRTIEGVASAYRERYCSGRYIEPAPAPIAPSRDVTARATSLPPPPPRMDNGANGITERQRGGMDALTSHLTSEPRRATPAALPCKVFTASYGGTKNILIRRRVGNEIQYTALQVLDGQENGLAEAFIRTHAQGGEPIGEFANRDAALASAFHRCPEGEAEYAGRRG